MSDIQNELIRLTDLRDKGLISQEDFEAEKARLLGQSDTGQPPEMPSSGPPPMPPPERPSVLRAQQADDIPPGIKGWSWGAFLWNWIWAIFNNTWIGLLALIPGVNLIMIFVLGAKGREWAWKNKKWDSVEHFNRVQRKWTLWGVWLMVAGFALAILITIASFIFVGMGVSKMSGADLMQVPSSDVIDSSAPAEEAANPMPDENATDTLAEDAVPADAAQEAAQDTTQVESDTSADDAAYAASAAAAAAADAAASEQEQTRVELEKMRAEAAAAKAEAAKAKKEAQKAEKALADKRRIEEEQRRIAEEQAAEEQMECPYSRSQPLTCSSRQGQPAYCDWNFKACGNPRIAKKESKTTCDGKVNWDRDSDQLIVTDGCRAQFVPVQ